MLKKIILAIQAILSLLVLVLVGQSLISRTLLKDFQPPPVLVQTVHVTSHYLKQISDRPGLCQSQVSAVISAQISGEIAQILVQPGQFVNQEMALLVFKSDLIVPKLQAALAKEEVATEVYQRQKKTL